MPFLKRLNQTLTNLLVLVLGRLIATGSVDASIKACSYIKCKFYLCLLSVAFIIIIIKTISRLLCQLSNTFSYFKQALDNSLLSDKGSQWGC